MRVLGPACGSGNFLYLALRHMLDVCKEAYVFCAEHGLPFLGMRHVSPSQLYRIEKNLYAHELASVVVWIGYLRWQKENGMGEDKQPILHPLTNIQHRDAILDYDAKGNPSSQSGRRLSASSEIRRSWAANGCARNWVTNT